MEGLIWGWGGFGRFWLYFFLLCFLWFFCDVTFCLVRYFFGSICLFVSLFVCLSVCMCVCLCVFVCVCVCLFIYLYIYIIFVVFFCSLWPRTSS